MNTSKDGDRAVPKAALATAAKFLKFSCRHRGIQLGVSDQLEVLVSTWFGSRFVLWIRLRGGIEI